MPGVLIIDDSKIMRVKCANILNRHGFTAVEAEDGEQGLHLVKQTNPDVILLDVVMPGIDGYEVLKRLKLDNRYKQIPVIMITVKAEKDDVVSGLNLGADDYISKPFQEQELIARVNAMLRIKRLYDKLLEQNKELTTINEALQTANEKIADQEKVALIGQFMVGVHHELRNPLAAALSDAQILLKFFPFEGEPGYFISDIEQQLQKMKNILNEIKEMDSVSLEEYVDGIKMVRLRKKKGEKE